MATAASSSSSIELCSVPLPLPQYHLLEIPNELLHLFDPSAKKKDDTSASEPAAKRRKTDITRLTIKGRYDDQAVLVTDTQTLALRAVSQSNSLLLCSIDAAPSTAEGEAGPSKPALYLQSNVTDTLELAPVVPRLDRLLGLLKPSQYDGEEERGSAKPVKKYTLKQLKSIVQASPAELEAGLIKNHVIEMDGCMRHISPAWTVSALQILISHLDLHALISDSVPLQETVEALATVHELNRQVVTALLTQFFGTLTGETVALDTKSIVHFLGVQSLKTARIGVPLTTFMRDWHAACLSPDFRALASLDLLSGYYILTPSPAPGVSLYPNPASTQIQFFSRHELPVDPAARFQDLFLTRPSWIAADLTPFIQDLALNDKKKDALLLKFARASKAKVLDWELSEEEKRMWNKDKRVVGPDGKAKNVWRDVVMYSARVKY
ncbi:Sister chromatid cohesion protein Dcc1 [Kalmanozyma brasiliensis GHG001]|uniref:Sister chromatid cohesion protein DCC1 n=1 Tax=Kalmanozyma brasiliensis (strain GHG001) TaxID=1365824 RepID=V5EV06_KALBG|nr:Sister chromatid cohesion protein Dcc1 [Kalmanozyma brasiliensis GHG001]EST09255.1 Sister chromatid cohesion protein Dcc1 [Kalmanozyma brasiliensis GHG001]